MWFGSNTRYIQKCPLMFLFPKVFTCCNRFYDNLWLSSERSLCRTVIQSTVYVPGSGLRRDLSTCPTEIRNLDQVFTDHSLQVSIREFIQTSLNQVAATVISYQSYCNQQVQTSSQRPRQHPLNVNKYGLKKTQVNLQPTATSQTPPTLLWQV